MSRGCTRVAAARAPLRRSIDSKLWRRESMLERGEEAVDEEPEIEDECENDADRDDDDVDAVAVADDEDAPP
jgi:hypothetical protein